MIFRDIFAASKSAGMVELEKFFYVERSFARAAPVYYSV